MKHLSDIKRARSGFTLMEVLVVIAIIGVLVAIVVAAFSGGTDTAKSAACAANRRSLKAYLSANILSDESFDAEGYAESSDCKSKYICPAGGIITVKVSDGSIINVTCDKHGGDDEDSYTKFVAELRNDSSDLRIFLDSLNLDAGKSLDYPLPEGGSFANHSNVIVNLAKDAGIDISKGSWRIYKWQESYSLYHIEENVLELEPGDKITVTKWNIGENTDGKKYTATGVVKTKASAGAVYNIIPNLTNGQMQEIK